MITPHFAVKLLLHIHKTYMPPLPPCVFASVRTKIMELSFGRLTFRLWIRYNGVIFYAHLLQIHSDKHHVSIFCLFLPLFSALIDTVTGGSRSGPRITLQGYIPRRCHRPSPPLNASWLSLHFSPFSDNLLSLPWILQPSESLRIF